MWRGVIQSGLAANRFGGCGTCGLNLNAEKRVREDLVLNSQDHFLVHRLESMCEDSRLLLSSASKYERGGYYHAFTRPPRGVQDPLGVRRSSPQCNGKGGSECIFPSNFRYSFGAALARKKLHTFVRNPHRRGAISPDLHAFVNVLTIVVLSGRS